MADKRGGGRKPPSPTVFQAVEGERTRLTDAAKAELADLRRRRRASGALSPRPYNLTISHRHRFIWFRNAKAGTRTIYGYLEQQDVRDLVVLTHTPYPTAAFEDYFKFGFVRHPLDRFVSGWQDKVVDHNYFGFAPDELERMRRIEAFAAWVADQDLTSADRHVALQSSLLDLTQVDYLGRVETFDADLEQISQRLGLPWRTPERRNRSTPATGTPSAELRAVVESAYRIDYQVFGYPTG